MLPKENWQHCLQNALTDPQELWDRLQLPPEHLPAAKLACQSFALQVPEPFLARIQKGNWNDPLLKQILPLFQETVPHISEQDDPLEEGQAMAVKGLLHKYDGRALIILTGKCAIQCRYCFRRTFPYAEHRIKREDWNTILEFLAADPSIQEVIWSGGDPFIQKDSVLKKLVAELAQIPHIQRLRIHTRLPIVIPSRITQELLDVLTDTRLQSVVVVHSNHPNEIDGSVHAALQKIRSAGIWLFNQSVLLRGINDCPETLAQLSRVLFEAGCLPYYLHLLDPVTGTHHFQVPLPQAKSIWQKLSHRLPGYLVPKLAREDAGQAAKTILAP